MGLRFMQDPRRRQEQRTEADGAQDETRGGGGAGRVFLVDGEGGANDADDAEEVQVEPAEESVAAVLPEDVEGRLQEYDEDGELRDVDGLGHCGGLVRIG